MRFTIAVVIFVGCAKFSEAQSPAETPSALVFPSTDAVLLSLKNSERPATVLRRNDVISVRILGIENFSNETRISDDGTATLPLLGDVPVLGLTLSQASHVIASQLQTRGMVGDAQVTVTAVSQPSNVVTVFGSVVRPGIFPAFGDLTILDYISQAGGFQEPGVMTAVNSSPANYVVTLTRPALGTAVEIPLATDHDRAIYGSIHLFPGDTVLVAKLGVIYAAGAFRNQGEFPLKNTSNTTVTQLIALAGGIGYEGDRKDAHIVRESGNGRIAMHVDIRAIIKGEKPDIALQANDILFVPSNDLKAAIKGGGSGLIVSLASAVLVRQ